MPRERLYEQISDELFERDYTEIEEDIRAYKKEALLKRLKQKPGK
jgi:hypothetical protein